MLIIVSTGTSAFANHIIGGEVFYRYLGPGRDPGTSSYEVSIRLFRDCSAPCGEGNEMACLPVVAEMTIYQTTAPYKSFGSVGAVLRDSQLVTLTTYPLCIAYRPALCYEVKTYSVNVTLPDTDDGFVIAYQNCCRPYSLNQTGVAFTGSGIPGATYTATIPGKKMLPAGHNSSAVLPLKDSVLVCLDSEFSVNFHTTDADGDSLSYAFTPAHDGGLFFSDGCIVTPDYGLDCGDFVTAGPPPYNFITYSVDQGFSGTQPMGPTVSIDPASGLISGYSPSYPGDYIVNITINEWRQNKVIATHQKDFVIHVADCKIPLAKLDSQYVTCNDFTLNFSNNSTSPLITTYNWDFGDPGNPFDTSTKAAPAYTYRDTGTYTVTLITNKDRECSDTTTTLAKVYPGFKPDFSASGGCMLFPYQFKDQTVSPYGTVNHWSWDFGDYSTLRDTSSAQNPGYAYMITQYAEVRLIVGDSKGCLDTIKKVVQAYDRPDLQLAFSDTTICVTDSLQLNAVAATINAPVYTWSPAVAISDANASNPFVYPASTTVYHVQVSDNGCTAEDSVLINVIPFLTIDLGRDTTLCLGDSLQLFPATAATNFSWSPATGINDSKAKDPVVRPAASTEYTVVATTGTCSATDSIRIAVAPYPLVSADADTAICSSATIVLHATTAASKFVWSPANSLQNANTLSPTARPQVTTAYIITVTDTLGCPKPASDTTIVTVVAVHVFAGNDTAIVVGEPLQLNASGGSSYAWSPATGMDNPYVANPVVVLGPQFDSISYRVTVKTAEGCTADDEIAVKVYKTGAEIFIPNAFTPDGDGLNDVLRPRVVGIKQFSYFRIYNRWGQLLYSSPSATAGWDGTYLGKPQPPEAYVYIAAGVDYTGRWIKKKGAAILIR